jgi:hypothetical protein
MMGAMTIGADGSHVHQIQLLLVLGSRGTPSMWLGLNLGAVSSI